MRVLFFGDVVGKLGRKAVKTYLPKLVEKYQIDFVIANGENASHGKGLTEKNYYELLNAGVDCVTLGNHWNSKKDIFEYIADADALVRPLNLVSVPGVGSIVFSVNGVDIRVTNVLGTAFMHDTVNNPFLELNNTVINEPQMIHIVDFHAEATGEKLGFAFAFDGKVSAVLGTHTHVQTNDARILEKGTAYITDVGMCGAANGVLGFEKTSVVNKTMFGSNDPFTLNEHDQMLVNAVVIDIDEETKLSREIFIVKILGE